MSDVKRYAYFFTRQDIIPEQQIVQTAHVALKLGFFMHERQVQAEIDSDFSFRKYDPNDTYFTVVGVRNLEGLDAVAKILDTFGFEYEVFIEPDMNDEATSIAVYPVDEDRRDILLAFNLLKV